MCSTCLDWVVSLCYAITTPDMSDSRVYPKNLVTEWRKKPLFRTLGVVNYFIHKCSMLYVFRGVIVISENESLYQWLTALEWDTMTNFKPKVCKRRLARSYCGLLETPHSLRANTTLIGGQNILYFYPNRLKRSYFMGCYLLFLRMGFIKEYIWINNYNMQHKGIE